MLTSSQILAKYIIKILFERSLVCIIIHASKVRSLIYGGRC
ncbi:hypothetical protein [Fischerella sp. JS2]|nr:hypothetical protein [Fischerella sp. JS2]